LAALPKPTGNYCSSSQPLTAHTRAHWPGQAVPAILSTGHVLFHGLGSLALCDPGVSIMTPFPTSLTLFLDLQDIHFFKMVTASQLPTHSSLSPLLRGLRSTPMSPQPAHPPGYSPSMDRLLTVRALTWPEHVFNDGGYPRSSLAISPADELAVLVSAGRNPEQVVSAKPP
jgi:hypothetical protein